MSIIYGEISKILKLKFHDLIDLDKFIFALFSVIDQLI